MCTPWTMTRLMRWRIGDWASCVSPCKLPSSSDDETRPSKEKQEKTKIYVIKPSKIPSKHKSNKHKLVPLSMPVQDSEQPNSKKTSSHCQSFKEEEDFIVFCFKEDGAFEIVKDEKSESAHHVKYRIESSRAVNRKLVYGEDKDKDKDNKHGNEDVSNEDGIEFDLTNEESDILADEEGEDEDNICFDSKVPHPEISTESHCKKGNDDYDESGKNSQESSLSTSTQSESSTGSFAFPVLRREWKGSPIKMPKPAGLHLRKHKLLHKGLQCCKF